MYRVRAPGAVGQQEAVATQALVLAVGLRGGWGREAEKTPLRTCGCACKKQPGRQLVPPTDTLALRMVLYTADEILRSTYMPSIVARLIIYISPLVKQFSASRA